MKKIDYKWKALALLWVAFFLQQGTRQIFSATLPSIRAAFDVSKAEIGLVATVFTFVYGICVPFAGIASDILKRKWMVAVGVLIFSLGVFGAGFANGILWLLVMYGVVNGLGQTFYYPASTSLVSQLHSNSRATALSILQFGLYAGIILVSWMSGYFADLGAEGWKKPFLLFGAIGVVWAVVCMLFLKDTPPAVHNNATPVKASPAEALGAILKNPVAIVLAAAFGMHVYVDVGYKTWMPNFLHTSFGLSNASASLWAVLWHYIGAIVGVSIGSRFADRFILRRGTVRYETSAFGMILAAPFIVLMAFMPKLVSGESGLALCLLASGLFGLFRGFFDSNIFAALFDVVPARFHASAMGLVLCAAFVVGSSSGGLIGLFSSQSMGLASLAPVYFAGGILLLIARRIGGRGKR